MHNSNTNKKWLVATVTTATIASTLYGCGGWKGKATSVEFVISPVSSLQETRAYVPEATQYK